MLPVDFNFFIPNNIIDADIILPSGEPVNISKFENMKLDFSKILKAYTDEATGSSKVTDEQNAKIIYNIKMSFNQQIKLASMFGDNHSSGFSLNLTRQSNIKINDITLPCSITAIGKKLASRAVKFDPGSIPRITLEIILDKKTISLIPTTDNHKYVSEIVENTGKILEEYKKTNVSQIEIIDKINGELHNYKGLVFSLEEEKEIFKSTIKGLEERVEDLKKIKNKWGLLDI